MWDKISGELLGWVRRYWHSPLAAILLILAVLIATLWFTSAIDLEKLSAVQLTVAIATVILAYSVWRYTTRLEHPRRGRIGFVVSIGAETKKHYGQLAQDFIGELRSLLDRSDAIYKYDLIELPEYHARRIKIEDDARYYLRATRSVFMIYGRARERELNGKTHHVLNLHGLVKHKPLAIAVSLNLSREFAEVMPRDIKIAKENDLLSFEFTAKWMVLVAQYIIGIASFLSGDLQYAQRLFELVRQSLGSEVNPIPPIRKIQQRLPVRLSEVYRSRASVSHRRWQDTHDLGDIDEMKTFLDLCQAVDPNSYEGRLLSAIWHFVRKRDVDAALSEIRKCKNDHTDDGTWRFSYAFLLAYRGELMQALRQYEIAARKQFPPTTITQVETFLEWLGDLEPEQVAVPFCMGAVNYFAKEDNVRALEEFEAFLRIAPEKDSRYREARNRASFYVRELRHRVGIGGTISPV